MTIKLATLIAVSDESIVDFGIGTPAQQAAAAARLAARATEREARWRALPLRVRLSRLAVARSYEPRRGLAHAWAALRGDDCR